VLLVAVGLELRELEDGVGGEAVPLEVFCCGALEHAVSKQRKRRR